MAAASGAAGGLFAPRERTASVEELDAETIFQQGEAQLERGRPDDAAELFRRDRAPAPLFRMGQARADHGGVFPTTRIAITTTPRIAAQRYLDFYPAEADAAYAQYLLALSYYDQMDQIGNDQAVAYDALQALRLVIERYPDSEYTQDAVLRFDVAMDQLAASEMEVGRYYLRRQHYTAAINRFRLVVEEFQTTSHTPEALLRLVEAYLSLGLTDEASTAGAILGYNFQGSPFYDDAFRQLTGQGLTPDAAGQGWLREVWDQTVRGDWL